jgi:hypothetical protein
MQSNGFVAKLDQHDNEAACGSAKALRYVLHGQYLITSYYGCLRISSDTVLTALDGLADRQSVGFKHRKPCQISNLPQLAM